MLFRSVLLLTTFDDDSFLDGGLAAGASGFLLKTTPPKQIAETIRTVRTGGEVPSPGPANRLGLRANGRGPAATTSDPDLTDREQEVLHLLCRARTNRQIARRLGLAQAAVKADIASMIRKMGVSSRLDVVVEAHRRSLADR